MACCADLATLVRALSRRPVTLRIVAIPNPLAIPAATAACLSRRPLTAVPVNHQDSHCYSPPRPQQPLNGRFPPVGVRAGLQNDFRYIRAPGPAPGASVRTMSMGPSPLDLLGKFDAHAAKMDKIIEHAAWNNDGEEIRRVKGLANDFIDQYEEAIGKIPPGLEESHRQPSLKHLRNLQAGLLKLFKTDRGRFEVGVLESSSSQPTSNILAQYRKGGETDPDAPMPEKEEDLTNVYSDAPDLGGGSTAPEGGGGR